MTIAASLEGFETYLQKLPPDQLEQQAKDAELHNRRWVAELIIRILRQRQDLDSAA